MGQNTEQYERLIDKVIGKYARFVSSADKEDLKQDARLELYLKRDKINSNRLAYVIIRNCIVDSIKRLPPRMENIDDPGTLRQYENQTKTSPLTDRGIEIAEMREALNKLDCVHKYILEETFGLNGPYFTEQEISSIYGRDRNWVSREKTKALKELRRILDGSKV